MTSAPWFCKSASCVSFDPSGQPASLLETISMAAPMPPMLESTSASVAAGVPGRTMLTMKCSCQLPVWSMM
ncbi:hypothetical protein [Massilia sp. S19_KUP03_FR1]|uniref:hypothetical protein n=1 Tax=Massilia sp. S19_KUP03_FR1 TaxID=3025503 RepID=UPI002FCD4747